MRSRIAILGPIPLRLEAAFVSVALTTAGQSALWFMAPFTRESRAFGGADRFALLSSDSLTYLSASSSVAEILASHWSRWAFLAVMNVGHHLGSASNFLVAVNLVASIVAGALLYGLVRRYAGRFGGVAAAAFYLANPLTAQWVRFVTTEALFYSLVLVAVFAGERVIRTGRAEAEWALVLTASTGMFIRPNGFLLLGSSVGLLLSQRITRTHRAIAAVVAFWIVLLVLIFGLSISGPDGEGDTFTSLIYQGVVLEGSPEVRVSIPMPPSPQSLEIGSLLRYSANHPLDVGELALRRVWLETHQVRRHYPGIVNLLIAVFMLTYGGLIISGASLGPEVRALRLVSAWFSVPLIALVAVTFAVPEGRYAWAYLLTAAPLAGCGAQRLVSVTHFWSPATSAHTQSNLAPGVETDSKEND